MAHGFYDAKRRLSVPLYGRCLRIKSLRSRLLCPPIGGLLCLTFYVVNLQYGGRCAKGVSAVEVNFG